MPSSKPSDIIHDRQASEASQRHLTDLPVLPSTSRSACNFKRRLAAKSFAGNWQWLVRRPVNNGSRLMKELNQPVSRAPGLSAVSEPSSLPDIHHLAGVTPLSKSPCWLTTAAVVRAHDHISLTTSSPQVLQHRAGVARLSDR